MSLLSCNRSEDSLKNLPLFDGEAAYQHLVAQVDLGYRYPGTDEHRQTQEYLAGVLSQYADTVEVLPFRAQWADASIQLWNLRARFVGSANERILLGAHWDTRPWADEDPDPANRRKPIAGANDGASGVAVLLELARVMKETRPPGTVEIVLFDAEDSGDIEGWRWCEGSRVYARRQMQHRPDFAIVVDLIGDQDQQIYIETNSQKYSLGIVRKVWDIARQLDVETFLHEPKHTVYDDHVPLILAGIPAIVIIDFDYPYWHTLEDTPDKCSPQSLENVGRVLVGVVYGRNLHEELQRR
jgi:hypothetical protein